MTVIFIFKNEVNDSRRVYPLVFRKYDHQDRDKISNRTMEEGNNRKVVSSRAYRVFTKVQWSQ